MRLHDVPGTVVRAALVVGFAIDAFVAILALFFQDLLGPLLDVPTKDPALTTVAGGEFLVASLVYLTALRFPTAARPLLWICALDQTLAALLPAIEIARGHVVATWKTIGPIPGNVLLAAIFVYGALRVQPGGRATATKNAKA